MFTGIIEATGTIETVETDRGNAIFWITSPISAELKVDQSVAHNGPCLTVDKVNYDKHRVTAVEETLKKTNVGTWKPGTVVNLERSMPANGRFDGHVVQGHVDTTAECIAKREKDGSWIYSFTFNPEFAPLIVEKGSICVNGISLTIFDISLNQFSVAIIPYTIENTNLKEVDLGNLVNIEFDIMGKYINRIYGLKV
jgi:riboflavin synthase